MELLFMFVGALIATGLGLLLITFGLKMLTWFFVPRYIQKGMAYNMKTHMIVPTGGYWAKGFKRVI